MLKWSSNDCVIRSSRMTLAGDKIDEVMTFSTSPFPTLSRSNKRKTDLHSCWKQWFMEYFTIQQLLICLYFLSLMSWCIAWLHCLQKLETQSLLKVVYLMPTLHVGSWLYRILSFCSGENSNILILTCWLLFFYSCFLKPFFALQTPAYDCRSLAQSHSPKHAGVSAAESHDLLQQRAHHPGAASTPCFPWWPPGGASRLHSVLHEGPSGGQLTKCQIAVKGRIWAANEQKFYNSLMCLCIVFSFFCFLIVELSEDSFSIGLHQ